MLQSITIKCDSRDIRVDLYSISAAFFHSLILVSCVCSDDVFFVFSNLIE